MEEASHPVENFRHAETPTSSGSPGVKRRNDNEDLLEGEQFGRFARSRPVSHNSDEVADPVEVEEAEQMQMLDSAGAVDRRLRYW